MIGTQYTVATPYGTFTAMWDEDESKPVVYAGSDSAMAFFRAYFDLTSRTGREGSLLSLDSLEPDDLYGFCQSPEFGILVLPEASDMLSLLMEEQQDEASETAVLDGIAREEARGLLTVLNTSGDPTGELRQQLADLMPRIAFASEDDRDAYIEAADLPGGEPVLDAVGRTSAKANPSVLPMGQGLKAILKAAREYAMTTYAGKTVTNLSDKSSIVLSRTGIKHTLSANAGLTNALVMTDLESLVRNGKFERQEAPKANKPNVLAVFRYSGSIEIDGKAVAVGFVVEELRDHRRYYHSYVLKDNYTAP